MPKYRSLAARSLHLIVITSTVAFLIGLVVFPLGNISRAAAARNFSRIVSSAETKKEQAPVFSRRDGSQASEIPSLQARRPIKLEQSELLVQAQAAPADYSSPFFVDNYNLLFQPSPAVVPQYQGYHDGIDCDKIYGWAWDRNQPNAPISVIIWDGSNYLGMVAANQFRQDLFNSNIGNGYHAFNFPTPDSLKDGQNHSIRVTIDNTYDLTNTPKVFNSVCGRTANLTPYNPPNWSDKIVVSNGSGTTIDSYPVYATDSLYVDWAIINNGTLATSASFYTYLYVDGSLRQSWQSQSLNSNSSASVQDYAIGSLWPGQHTIKIVTDSTGAVTESNESDNQYTKTVNVQTPPDISVSVTPITATVTQGGTATYNVTVQSLYGFSGQVSLSAYALPNSPAVPGTGFSPQVLSIPANGSATSLLSITTNNSSSTGTSTFYVYGDSGSLSRSTSATITVNPAPPPDFTISASPSINTVAQGGVATYTVTAQSLNGFSSPVSLQAYNIPGTVLTGTGFTPQTVTPPANGSVSATFKVVTNNSTPTGSTTIYIYGDGGALSRSTSINLTVNPPPVPDFTVSVDGSTQTVRQGDAGSFTLNVQSVNGFNSPISLYALNLPPGYVAQSTRWSSQTLTPPANGLASSSLTITTGGATQTGTFPIILRGVSGSLTRDTTVNLIVTGSSADFSIDASPATQTVLQGETGSFNVNIHSLNGFSNSVSLYALNLPPGYVAQGTAWNPSSVAPSANGVVGSTLTIRTNGATQAGTFNLTLRGVSGNLTRDTNVSLTVASVTNSSFSIQATPAEQTISQGQSATFAGTIQSLNGFSGPVTLAALNLPAGFSAQDTGWSQQVVTPAANGSTTSTLTVATNGTTQVGTFPITLRAVSNDLSSETTVNLTVVGNSLVPAASFTFTPQSPTTGQPVQFNNVSSGPSLIWAWDFDGNGITDSTAQNPVYTFTSTGPHQVTLKASNAYGSDIRTQEVQVGPASTTSSPVIVSVSRQYPGVFLKGGYIDLRFNVGVDWKGSIGKVRFSVNGGPTIEENGTSTGASHTFVVNRDFLAGTTPSVITITPVNGVGQSGAANTQKVYVYKLPAWLQTALARNPTAMREALHAGNLEYSFSWEFPDPHLGQNSLIHIPSLVPYLGDGPFGMAETYVSIDGKIFPATGRGSLGASGHAEFRAMGNVLSASLGANGEFQLTPPSGLMLTGGSLNVNLKGTLSREEGIISAIPTLRPLLTLPYIGGRIKTFSDAAKLRMELSPSLNTTFRFAQNISTGKLGFSEGTAQLGVNMKAALRAHVGPLSAEAWVSGGGSGTYGVPEPYVRKLELNAQAGVRFDLDALFDLHAEASCDFGVRWTPSTGVVPYFCGSSNSNSAVRFGEMKPDNALSLDYGKVSLIKHDYERHGPYSAFRSAPLMRKMNSTTPVTVQESTFLSNIFPGASPTILQINAGRMMLWVHQEPGLPILQSTNISWSTNSGSGWSVPQSIAQDTQAELSPVAGVDGDGKVVAAWLRIKDAAFSEPISTTGDLPRFYKRLEVVSSTFNPSTQTWSAINSLTDDANLDTSLILSSDGAGHLLLTWLSNSTGEFNSTSTSPSNLNYSFWNGSSWSAPATAATGLIGVNSHVAAMRAGKATVIIPRDPDQNIDGDGQLDVYTWDGTSWSSSSAFAAGSMENKSPTIVYDGAGEAHIVWIRGNDLVYATLSHPTPQVIRPGSASLGFSDAKLLVNAQGNLTLIWQQTIDNNPSNIFAMLYDPATQTWSADRRLNDDPAMSHNLNGFYGGDGDIHLAYLNTQISRTEDTVTVDGEIRTIPNIPQDGQTDLRLLDHSLINDLAVSDTDLTVTPQQPQDGETVTANVDVHNGGDFPVESFVVNLYVGEPGGGGVLVGTSTIESLLAGDHRLAPFSFTMPGGGGNIFALVDAGNNVVEFTETNNKATAYVNNTAPQARIVATVTSGSAPLTVDFDASSSFDSEGDEISYAWTFADGSQSLNGAIVSHTFEQVGLYPATVALTDSHGAVGMATVTINVGCSELSLLPANISEGRVGAEYNQTVTAVGGNPPYTFAVVAGSLPDGLTLSPSGQITGTPTDQGQFNFTISVSYANGCTQSRDYTLNIQPSCSYAISQTSGNISYGGGTGSVNVVTDGDCQWNAVSNNSWITITSGNSGSGNGTITFTVAANNSISPRSGSLTVANLTYTINQLAFHAQLADFDGDRKTDIAVWQSDSGIWHIINSASGALRLAQWGQSSLGDLAAPGDYDGDGRTDIAIFRPSDGNWYILQSSDGASTIQNWGQAGDRPVPADYDGDGRTDVSVYRPTDGNWYVRKSSGGSTVRSWGNPSDKLVPGDYDGDGLADFAVYRPSDGNWYILKSTGGLIQQNWGIGEDRPVAGDYDGDGRTDIAVFRPSEGNWYVLKSSGGNIIRNWGDSTDRPVPGDYDGDGKTDIAVWRPSQGTWYILQSGTNSGSQQYLGGSADIPLPAACLPQ
jgi:PKD repeat protein